MPRIPAQPPPKRKYCRTEFHPDAEEYLKDLADDVGVQVAYVIRQCVQRALPEVEEILRGCIAENKEMPEDELKRPTKPLKTTLRRSRQTPDKSRLAPPPLVEFLETGEMPGVASPPPESAGPPAEDLPRSDRQAPEEPAGPAAEALPTSDPGESSPPSSEDLFRAKLARVKRQRRG